MPGPKTVTLTVTKDGCTSTTSQTINVAPLPTISFSVSPTSGCTPLAVTITQSSPNLPGHTYIWDYGNGVQDTNYTPTSPIIYNNTSTTSSQTYTISHYKLSFWAAASAQRALAATVRARPPYGRARPSPLHIKKALASKWYYTIKLIVITDKGCKDSLRRPITVRPRVIAGFTAPALVCEGVSVTFTNTSSGANSYQWNFGDGSPTSTATSPTYTYSTPGTYTVQLIAINTTTGCRDTFQQSINVNPIPNPTFTRAPTGGCVPLTVNLTDTTPFDPTYLYIWDYGNSQRDTSYTPNNPTYTSAGTYTVSLEVVTPAGCRRTTTASVTVSPLPTANFSAPASACARAPVTFTNASTGATSYQWDFGDGVGTSTATNPTYAYTTAGTFTVTLIATSGAGCRDTFTRPITIYPRPTADFSYTIECLGSPTSFTDNSIGAVSYQWNFGDGSTVSTLPNPTHTYAAPRTYTVRLIVTSADGCKDTVTKSVPVNATPNPNFSFTTVCLGQATSFTDLTPGTPTGWEWDFGDGVGSTLQNPTHTYATAGTYSVTLVVTNAQGCKDTIQKAVVVHPRPTAGFQYDTACAYRPTVFTDQSQGGVTFWSWDFGDGSPTSPLQTKPHPCLHARRCLSGDPHRRKWRGMHRPDYPECGGLYHACGRLRCVYRVWEGPRALLTSRRTPSV
jgi:PKD repeat protein